MTNICYNTPLRLLFSIILTSNLLAIEPTNIEQTLTDLIANDPAQMRSEFVYDPTLHFIARERARDMGERGYFGHTNPDNYGPNKIVELAGYDLPSIYTSDNTLNYIESIAAGYSSVQEAFQSLKDSASHSQHIFGEIDAFKNNTRYGIGHVNVPGSPFTNYYVVIIAPKESADRPLDPYTEWKFEHFSIPNLDAVGDEGDPDGNGLLRIEEFAFGVEPGDAASVPQPFYDKQTECLAWDLPTRADLGSVVVDVEFTSNILEESFDKDRVTKVGDRYCGEVGPTGFMRYRIYSL